MEILNIIALLLLTYYSEIRHGDTAHDYGSNDIFGFAVSPGLTKILPIEKRIFVKTTCIPSVESSP